MECAVFSVQRNRHVRIKLCWWLWMGKMSKSVEWLTCLLSLKLDMSAVEEASLLIRSVFCRLRA